MTYYVYIDWTCEDVPRPFYVGKGNENRVLFESRNKHHDRIAVKYGMHRELVFATSVEQLALDAEIELIAAYKTFVYAPDYVFGANYTRGGEGTSGFHHSQETLMKNSETMRRLHSQFEFKLKHANGIKESALKPGARDKRVEAAKKACSRAEVKAKRSDSQKRSWTDIEIKQRRVESTQNALRVLNIVRRQKRAELHRKIVELIASGVPRLAIAEQLGTKLYDVYKATRLHNRAKRTG